MAVLFSAEAHALPWQQPEHMVVSPDGRHVYVSSGQGLLALARDQRTGALELVGSYPLAQSASNVQGVEPLAISPDGLSVYATPNQVPAGTPFKPPIRAFARDPITGLLDPRSVEGPPSPMGAGGFLVGRTHVLASVWSPRGESLRAYERLPSGGLRSVGGDLDGLSGLRVTRLSAIDAQDRLYVELDNYRGSPMSEPYEDYVGVFPFTGGSVAPGQLYRCPRGCPTHLASDGLRMYGDATAERDPASGALTFPEVGYRARWDSGYREDDRATWGRSLYEIDGYGHNLRHLRDTGSDWAPEEIYRDGQDGARGIAGGRALAASPDGRHLYVAAGRWGGIGPQDGYGPFGRPKPGTVATYERDPDGKLRYRSIFFGPEHVDFEFNLETNPASIRPDRARPVVARVKRRAARGKRARRRRDAIRVRVRDRGSGVGSIQITRRRAKPGRWRVYKARRSYVVGRGRLHVRVRDRAGNSSRWKAVRRR